MGTVTPVSAATRPCFQCAYSTGISWLSCTRLTGTPDCKRARAPGSLCGVNGVLWHADVRYAPPHPPTIDPPPWLDPTTKGAA